LIGFIGGLSQTRSRNEYISVASRGEEKLPIYLWGMCSYSFIFSSREVIFLVRMLLWF
jgi:hypothetical protein